MKKYSNYFWVSLLIILITYSGCDSFLDQYDPSNIAVDNYYTHPEHAESAVTSIYTDLAPVYNGGGFGGSPWLMLEFATGTANTVALGSSGPVNSSIRMLNMDADNAYPASYWNSHYRGIGNANLALAKIPGIQMDEARKQQLLGEAHVLRAYYYFNLVRLFGDVPLITETIDLTSAQLFPKRTGIEEIYALIVADLQAAEQSGLSATDINGRVSMGAVKSLLAMVYLTMAGQPYDGGTTYYQLARDKADEVIRSGDYWLFETYQDLKDEGSQNQGEHIFMVQYDELISNRNGFQELFVPNQGGISAFISETGMLFPEQEFLSIYELGDKRLEEKQFFYRTFTSKTNRNIIVNLSAWHIYKWFDEEAHLSTGLSGTNWPLIRYAEVLLTFAEAEGRIAGATDAALSALNAIRRRADLLPLDAMGEAQFLEEVWKERWRELCFENKTWFDMVRLRKALNLETGTFDGLVGHQFIYGPTFTERNLLFPLPATEVANNKNLLPQNSGY